MEENFSNLLKETVTFQYKKSTRRLKRLENNVFIIYSPEKIKLKPGEIKQVNMQIKIYFSKNILGTCRILYTLSNHGVKLLNSNTISQEINSNIDNSIYTDENNLPPWNLHFELYNSNFTETFQIRKRQELGYFVITNDRGKEINFKYEKE